MTIIIHEILQKCRSLVFPNAILLSFKNKYLQN